MIGGKRTRKKTVGEKACWKEFKFKWVWDKSLHHLNIDVKNTLQVTKNSNLFITSSLAQSATFW